MLLTGIDHVQIAAPPGSESQARHFFGQVLGLEEIVKPPSLRSRGGCWFRVGEGQLHVGIEADFRAAKKAHPAFVASDIDLLATRLAESGASVRWDDQHDGGRRFYSDDPWGNRMEFTESAR